MGFAVLVAVASVLAGATAAVAGFGIGSLLTPVFAARLETKVAVAAVAIPHVAATALRLWRMRAHVDGHLLRTFGAASAAGGLVGALLHARLNSPTLGVVFGGLLLFAGVSELAGWTGRMRFRGAGAYVAGALSGLFGGLVGNQGGIRSAALLGFDVPRTAFVATATAAALAVDLARLPVYVAAEGARVWAEWPMVALATAGAIAGTLVGVRLLDRLPEARFRLVVAAVLILLGLVMLVRSISG